LSSGENRVILEMPMSAVLWWLIPGVLASLSCLGAGSPGAVGGQASAAETFLSEARYLVSQAERKDLLDLPEPQRADFIEQFWKRRDSDPATPVNEFKEEYFRRVRRANEVFAGESRPGWLTDRGRVAILYGEPARRERQPPAAGKIGPCLETWHYDDFPVVFTDKSCAGTFLLATRDLSPLSRRDIAMAARARSRREPRKLPFDFAVHILKRPVEVIRLEAFVKLSMAYPEIWFDFRDGRFATSFAVEMELADSRKAVRWKFKGSFPLSLTPAELEARRAGAFEIEVPLTIEEGLDELRAGKCQLSIIMENETSKERVRKVAEFAF